mgnify:CR=1 FL=1
MICVLCDNDTEFDKEPYLFTFENKTYDLKSGSFIQPKPEYYISLSCGYNYIETDESENQKRQQALHNFSKESLLVEDNIWSGLGLLRGGGITAMVGSYKEIADLIEKFYIWTFRNNFNGKILLKKLIILNYFQFFPLILLE